MNEAINTRSTTAEANILSKVLTAVSVTVLTAVFLGWVVTAGDARVNAQALASTGRRLDRFETWAEHQARETGEVKAELRAIKAILDRMEKQMEGKKR